MNAQVSIRALFVLVLLSALVLYFMRGPNLRVEFHEDVSNWETLRTDGVTTWRQDWGTIDHGQIQYSDINADGRIDTRIEQQREYAILAFDNDHDGVFDEQWVQKLSKDRVHAAEVSPIQYRVPDTTANEQSDAPKDRASRFDNGNHNAGPR